MREECSSIISSGERTDSALSRFIEEFNYIPNVRRFGALDTLTKVFEDISVRNVSCKKRKVPAGCFVAEGHVLTLSFMLSWYRH